MYISLKFNFVKKLQENAQAKLLTTSMCCVNCDNVFKKIEPQNFCKITFSNLDLQETRIFLKTHTKRLMFHYQLFYSVQPAFLVLESSFGGGIFQKILIFCYSEKWCFCKRKCLEIQARTSRHRV